MHGIEVTEPRTFGAKAGENVSKHQSILTLDMATWQDLIDVFDIKESMIPHRVEEQQGQLGTRGWYS